MNRGRMQIDVQQAERSADEFADLYGSDPIKSDPQPSIGDAILCPISGEAIDRDDVDALIDGYERLATIDSRIYAAKLAIRSALAAKTVGDTKTRRVQGLRRQAVVEMPGDSWDGALLREVWDSFPTLREGYLRIGKIEPKLREIKKLAATSGTAQVDEFRELVLRANRGPQGVPTVKIER